MENKKVETVEEITETKESFTTRAKKKAQAFWQKNGKKIMLLASAGAGIAAAKVVSKRRAASKAAEGDACEDCDDTEQYTDEETVDVPATEE